MFKGKKIIMAYIVAAFAALYVYVITQLINLGWFTTVGFPTLVFYGFLMLIPPIVMYNIVVAVVKPED